MFNKKIVLCADDYGQNLAISRGIIELIQKNRISAVSCLVNYEDFGFYADQIKPFIDKIDVGLHFDLGNSEHKLIALLIKSKLHLVKRTEIEIEFNQQLNRFISLVGKQPDFIDGHRHIHQFPVICDAIFNVCEKRLDEKPYIRYVNYKSINDLPTAKFKSLLIKGCTDFRFEQKLIELNIPYNKSFSGIYGFNASDKYNLLFPKFLAHIEDNGIIMCHPSLLSNDPHDPIAKSRYDELQYFSSNKFLTDCQNAKINIAKFKHFT